MEEEFNTIFQYILKWIKKIKLIFRKGLVYLFYSNINQTKKFGGQDGIRTHERVAPLLLSRGAFDRSATCPLTRVQCG